MPRSAKEQSQPVATPQPSLSLAQIDQLGKHTEKRWVTELVQVGQGDKGPIMSQKERLKEFTSIGPMLTLDEARLISNGKADWEPTGEPGEWRCLRMGAMGMRQFMVTQEIYDQL